MMSAKILTYSVTDDETVAELQLKIEKDTGIPAANQELLLEAGLALEAHGLATQCAVDYSVMWNTKKERNQQRGVVIERVEDYKCSMCVCRRLTGGGQTCPWFSCSIAPPAVMNRSLLLVPSQKTSALSVSSSRIMK